MEQTTSSQSRPSSSRPSLGRDLLIGIAAGLAASAVTGKVDQGLDRWISPRQKRRVKRLRVGSPHDVAGPRFASQLLGRRPTKREKRASELAFNTSYGVGWGLVHASVRRFLPAARRFGGLPFAVPFYFLCDAGIAPRLGLTPPPWKLPWQPNAKELANHVAWTATAEGVHRAARKIGS